MFLVPSVFPTSKVILVFVVLCICSLVHCLLLLALPLSLPLDISFRSKRIWSRNPADHRSRRLMMKESKVGVDHCDSMIIASLDDTLIVVWSGGTCNEFHTRKDCTINIVTEGKESIRCQWNTSQFAAPDPPFILWLFRWWEKVKKREVVVSEVLCPPFKEQLSSSLMYESFDHVSGHGMRGDKM